MPHTTLNALTTTSVEYHTFTILFTLAVQWLPVLLIRLYMIFRRNSIGNFLAKVWMKDFKNLKSAPSQPGRVPFSCMPAGLRNLIVLIQ
ncbi:hypothetical protein BDR04DRAFT_1088456 [Suillus decipiens]|nr:hypothetical protein BDR04DRAFT_1088456 [Suillus decipiens]